MNQKAIEEFLIKLSKEEKFKESFLQWVKKLKQKDLSKKDHKRQLLNLLLQWSKKLGYSFTRKDLLDFDKSLKSASTQYLSKDKLQNVSGGFSLVKILAMFFAGSTLVNAASPDPPEKGNSVVNHYKVGEKIFSAVPAYARNMHSDCFVSDKQVKINADCLNWSKVPKDKNVYFLPDIGDSILVDKNDIALNQYIRDNGGKFSIRPLENNFHTHSMSGQETYAQGYMDTPGSKVGNSQGYISVDYTDNEYMQTSSPWPYDSSFVNTNQSQQPISTGVSEKEKVSTTNEQGQKKQPQQQVAKTVPKKEESSKTNTPFNAEKNEELYVTNFENNVHKDLNQAINTNSEDTFWSSIRSILKTCGQYFFRTIGDDSFVLVSKLCNLMLDVFGDFGNLVISLWKESTLLGFGIEVFTVFGVIAYRFKNKKPTFGITVTEDQFKALKRLHKNEYDGTQQRIDFQRGKDMGELSSILNQIEAKVTNP